MKIKDFVLQITNQYFPGHVAIMLIGSQSRNELLNPDKDCDILVLHPDYSKMFNKKLTIAKQQLDFTILPLSDIENILYNESHDIYGILATMISQGLIIHDTYETMEGVQKYVHGFYTAISYKTKKHYNGLVDDLKRMAKRFGYEMPGREKIFLMCEFVSTVLSVEAIKSEQSLSRIKRKARMIHLQNQNLSNDLIALAKDIPTNENLQPLQIFWDSYSKSLANDIKLQPVLQNKVLFDLDFDGFSLQRFIESVLPQIQATPFLNNTYKYYYLSPKNYSLAYKNKVSIVFEIDDAEILLKLEEALKNTMTAFQQAECTMIFSKRRNVSESFNIDIENLNYQMCQLHTELVTKENYLNERFLIATELCCHLMQALNLGRDDFEKVNSYLVQRWIFSVKEQRDAWPFKSLIAKKHEKITFLNTSFSDWQLEVFAVMTGVFDGLIKPISKKQVIIIDYILKVGRNKQDYAPSDDSFIKPILQYYEIEKCHDAFIYLTVAEEIAEMLCLSAEQKKECFLLLLEGSKFCKSDTI